MDDVLHGAKLCLDVLEVALVLLERGLDVLFGSQKPLDEPFKMFAESLLGCPGGCHFLSMCSQVVLC